MGTFWFGYVLTCILIIAPNNGTVMSLGATTQNESECGSQVVAVDVIVQCDYLVNHMRIFII